MGGQAGMGRHQNLFLCSEGCAQACPLSPALWALLGFVGRGQLAGPCSALWTEVTGEGIFWAQSSQPPDLP